MEVLFLTLLYQVNPFGTLDTGTMMAGIANFIDMFKPAIILIVAVYAGVVVVRGVRSIMGGGG